LQARQLPLLAHTGAVEVLQSEDCAFGVDGTQATHCPAFGPLGMHRGVDAEREAHAVSSPGASHARHVPPAPQMGFVAFAQSVAAVAGVHMAA
jgi:hypothetical protein